MGGSRGGEELVLRTSSAPGLRTTLGLHDTDKTGSTLSVDAVAQAEDYGSARPSRHRKKASLDRAAVTVLDGANPRSTSPLPIASPLNPVTEGIPSASVVDLPARSHPNRQRSASLAAPKPQRPGAKILSAESPPLPYHPNFLVPPSPPTTRASSTDGTPRRRRPPPPPLESTSRPRTPSSTSYPAHSSHPSPIPSPVPGHRRAAPEPPSKSRIHVNITDATRGLDALALKPCHSG